MLINKAPPSIWNKGIGNDLFGSQAAMASPKEGKKTKTQQDVDDFLYELLDRKMPDLELGDGLLNSLGTTAQNLFDTDAPPSKKEEEDEILKDIMDEYDIENIKNTMDETAQVPESIYLFYGGDSEQFVNALEFIGLSPINRDSVHFCCPISFDKQCLRTNLAFMLKRVKFSTIITTLEETFTIFCCLNKMTRWRMCQKRFQTETVLRLTLALFYKVFRSTIKKSLIFSLLKIPDFFSFILTILLR